MREYQESVTTGQTDGQTDAGQSDPYVPLCFAGDTKINNTSHNASRSLLCIQFVAVALRSEEVF